MDLGRASIAETLAAYSGMSAIAAIAWWFVGWANRSAFGFVIAPPLTLLSVAFAVAAALVWYRRRRRSQD